MTSAARNGAGLRNKYGVKPYICSPFDLEAHGMLRGVRNKSAAFGVPNDCPVAESGYPPYPRHAIPARWRDAAFTTSTRFALRPKESSYERHSQIHPSRYQP